ncbi:MAG: sugar ABC transporter permease [Clostridia bacterium]|nr:sugar ABC transporter permease [Clostridia bacterium]
MNKNKYALESGVQDSPSAEGEIIAPRKAGIKKIFGMQKSHFFFYLSIVAFPVLQFLVFYVYMNLNSFMLSFQRYDIDARGFVWNGLENFQRIFQDFTSDEALSASVGNSINLFLLNLVFSNFGTIVFSYYIYKDYPGSKIFKVILYAPHIISNIIVVIMFKFFVDTTIPKIWLDLFGQEIYGLLANKDTQYVTVLFFSIWISFGTQVLVYSGTMSSISDSVIESAKLDGITPVKELFYIVIPMVWPTTVTFLISAFAGIFTNQMQLFSFFGSGADPSLQTFGYLLYAKVQQGGMTDYPYLSALGLLMTCIAAPLTLLVRWALEKYGPSTT